MATEFLLPNGDDSGWTTGGFEDINELVSAPNDSDFIQTAANGKGEAILLDLVDSALADADTINTVTINIRARLNAGTPATVGAELLIGGVVQGAINDSGTLSSSFANFAINASQWNIDWTAAQLDGMQIRLTARQAGMPVDIQVEVSACDVEIDYTSGAGGTLFFQDAAGVITPTGAIIRDTFKELAGVLAPIGVLIRETLKQVAGALTPTGFALGIKIAVKSIAGVLTPVGDLVKETQKSLAGSLTPVGTIVRDIFRFLAGVITPVGTLVKETLKQVAGALTPTGFALGIKIAVKSIAGALTPVGDLVKETQKSLAGSLEPVGTFVKETLKQVAGLLPSVGFLFKRFPKNVDGVLTPTGLVNTIVVFTKSIAGSLTPSSTLTKLTLKALVGSLSSSGGITKTTLKLIGGNLTPSGLLATTLLISKLVDGALAFIGDLATTFIPAPPPVVRLYRRFLTVISGLRHKSK